MSCAIVVVNPRAGSLSEETEALARRLGEHLAERGISVVSVPFDARRRKPGSWASRLDVALAEGADRVYVLGGDGTVLAVASELLGKEVALGIIPLGTANLLARDLAIPLEPEAAIAALIDARIQRIDVGRVNGEAFLCASMLGLSTALARAREAARGSGLLRLWGRLLRKTLLMLGRYPYRRVELDLDGELVSVSTRAMVITNNPVTGAIGLYPRREKLDGGVLAVYGVHRGPLWELPRLALRLINGAWRDEPRIFHYVTRRIRIRARRHGRMTVMNDGERRRLGLPLRYEILPSALSVLVPARAEEDDT